MSVTQLFVDAAVASAPLAQAIAARMRLAPVVVDNVQDVYSVLAQADDPIGKGKEVLFLTNNKGAFVKACPGTRCYTCCDYKILHVGSFCLMDCSYCILQTYFHPPVLQYFVNHDDLLAELERLLAERRLYRVGTGEFTDSLIWELWTDLSQQLVPRFGRQRHAVLELKTKTTAVEGLADLPHRCKTIMSWSLNTPAVIQSEERGTAALDARLRAATQCQEWGYPLAFHFDPMVIYDGCEDDYRHVLERLFNRIEARNIVWISLGTFRFIPGLKPIVQARFPQSKIVYGEFIAGLDGKMRYFKPLRIALYRRVASWIREFSSEVVVYLCMEDDEVWHKALGFVPTERGGLARMLDKAAVAHCGLHNPF